MPPIQVKDLEHPARDGRAQDGPDHTFRDKGFDFRLGGKLEYPIASLDLDADGNRAAVAEARDPPERKDEPTEGFDCQAKVDQLRERLGNKEASYKIMRDSVRTTMHNIEIANIYISDAELDIRDLEDELSALKKDLNAKKASRELLRGMLSGEMENCQKLNAEVAQTQAEIQKLER